MSHPGAMGLEVPFVESVSSDGGSDEVLDDGPWGRRLDRLFAPRLLRGLVLAAAATAVVANFGATPVATGHVGAPRQPARSAPALAPGACITETRYAMDARQPGVRPVERLYCPPGARPATASIPAATGDVGQSAGVPIGSGPPYNHAPAEDPAACPVHLTCAVSTSLPASVLSALRTDLPGVRVNAVSSTIETAARRIRFRQINATYRGADVLVRITRPAPDALRSREETDHVPAELVRFVAVATPDGFEVQVQFTGSPRTTPPITLARALAHDRRLLAPA